MDSQKYSPPSGASAFPQPRLNRALSRFIDQALVLAIHHPSQAREMLYSAEISTLTITRLLTTPNRRRPIHRSANAPTLG